MHGRALRSAMVAMLGTMAGVGGATIGAMPANAAPVQIGVNAGGAAYTSGSGESYSADSGFTGGTSSTTTAPIAGTVNDALYQSQHYAMSDWSTAVPNGTYRVKLALDEIYWNAAGKRIFSVAAAGVPIVTNLDVYALVGKDHAYVVTKDLQVTGGLLDLHFAASVDFPAVAAILVTALSTAPPPGVPVAPAQSIQAAVDAQPPGTTFLLSSSTYRMQSVHPKSGDTFIGRTGTVMSGANVLAGWTQSGSAWTVGGQTQNGAFYGQCLADHPMCSQPEDLFIDGQLRTAVSSVAAVVPGTWFFDHAANTITVGDDPTGRQVETSVTTTAFDGLADHVTIENMTIQMYATELQNGTIQAGPRPGAWPDGGTGWLLQDLTVRWNHGVGIAMGNGTILRRVQADQNGNLGIIGNAASGGLVEQSEIAGNNTVGVDSGWSAGGAKWAGDYNNLVVRDTSVHDNNGPGLWVDESCYNTTFTNNTVTNNASSGIFVEISYKALVQANTVVNNGLAFPNGWLWNAGIQVAASSDVEVTGNTVQGNANAIAGIQQSRGSGTLGAHILRNLNVHNNNVTLSSGGAGVVEDTGDTSVFTTLNNHFTGNSWVPGAGPSPYAWGNQWNSPAQWTATGNS